jgi:hypothetical protein
VEERKSDRSRFIPAALVARPWDFDDGDRDSSLRIAHKKIK